MKNNDCPDPSTLINRSKRPLNPDKNPPIPDRVLELHRRGGERTPEEKNLASTYYPSKNKRPGGVA